MTTPALAVFRVLAVDIIGKALGRAANVIQVHAVRARAEHAAHARRTEGQLSIESILDSFSSPAMAFSSSTVA